MTESDSEETAQMKPNVSNLRLFRLNKSSIKTVPVPGKRRIQMMADDDSDSGDNDDEPKRKKPSSEILPNNKEQHISSIKASFPQYSTMEIQDALVVYKWNVNEAYRHLKAKSAPEKKAKPIEASKEGSKASGYSDDSDTDIKQSVEPVYDSDDSDVEVSKEVVVQRLEVLKFINTSNSIDLQAVKTLTDKKASQIINIRPFKDWSDLCKKLKENKLFSSDLLNNTQELINKQTNVNTILNKCNKMVIRMEDAIQAGGGIVEQPRLLNSTLKLQDYQLVGLNWLAIMHAQKMNGILADEMGLGKTIQVIAFLAYLKENNLSKGAHLIVVPSSTIDNWEYELSKWCPTLVVEKYQGNQNERRKMRVRFAKEGFTGFDVLLATYHLVGNTPEERKMFRVCKLHYVVFDEAHMLKNMTTQRYANLISINAKMRILLTGTPLQNNLLELMSLLCFVMPKFFSKSIEDIRSLFAKKTIENGNETSSQFQETQIERARHIMKPFFLRRLKKEVLGYLPKKLTTTETVPMTDSQKEIYQELITYYRNNKLEYCTGDRAGLSIMMDMRKAANHPLLLRNYFTDEDIRAFSRRLASKSSYKKTNPQYIFEELAVMSDFQVWQLCQKHEMFDIKIPDDKICNSGKFRHFDTLLPKLKSEGHRILIFSQFTMMLDIIEEYLNLRKLGFFRLDGSTAVDERQDLINEFNTNPDIFIFLLSTKAGGVGINLTAADTCIIHDIDFNPYNDKQAEDRCHRMGQTRTVTIYRLVSEGTIEEGILSKAAEKLKLEQDITSAEGGEAHAQKCVVRLLTMTLGLDKEEEEHLNKLIKK